MRRVVNCAKVPFKHGWRLVSRGIRGVLVALDMTREVLELRSIHHSLDCALQRICCHRSPQCLCCQVPLPCSTIITADIDQAFESCDSSRVWAAWCFFASQYITRFTSYSVTVKRGKRYWSRPGNRGFGVPLCLSPYRCWALQCSGTRL